jgi:hypothetical protein
MWAATPTCGEDAERIMASYTYRTEVLESLVAHGVRPTTSTPPELVREYLNDLYRYELRRLRDRLVARHIPKLGYFDRVVEVRKRYPLLSVKPHLWLEDGAGR